MTQEAPQPEGKATFEERSRCIACGCERLETLWSGRFSDPEVEGHLEKFRYSGDPLSALGEHDFRRVACSECGISFHQRILTDDWLRTLYSEWIDDEQIERFESEKARGDADFVRGQQLLKHALRIRALLHVRDAPHGLLDFGCGDGRFLAAANLLGFQCYGIDFSATRADRAGRSGISILPDLEAFDAIECPPLDAATCFEVLEHVSDPLGLLEALAARMRPGAVLLVEVPDCSGIDCPRDFDQFHCVQPLEHINHFTPETLKAFCARAGFEPAPRVPAHVTTNPLDLVKTEASRFLEKPRTSQYFRLGKG